MAFDLAIGIAVQATVAGIATPIDLARSRRRCMGDIPWARLRTPGNRADSSRSHVGRFLDKLQ
eukprot:4435805-Pyramimonas_sp.AAC.1